MEAAGEKRPVLEGHRLRRIEAEDAIGHLGGQLELLGKNVDLGEIQARPDRLVGVAKRRRDLGDRAQGLLVLAVEIADPLEQQQRRFVLFELVRPACQREELRYSVPHSGDLIAPGAVFGERAIRLSIRAPLRRRRRCR
jgi:hypothetical protein